LIGGAIATECPNRVVELLCPDRESLDLSNPGDLDRLDLDGVSTVIHAAGVTDEEVAKNPGEAILRASVKAAGLFERLAEAGIRHHVYISSSHVYGAFEGPKTERSPANPLSDYAICHFATEQVIRRTLRRYGGSALFVRPNAVFGMPPDPTRFTRWALIPFEFPRDLVQKGVITIRSSGDQVRNFVSIKDIADGIATWLTGSPANGATVWNPVGPLTCSVFDFALICKAAFESVTAKEGRVERGSGSTPGGDFRLESDWQLTLPHRTPHQFVEGMVRWLIERGKS
jgi:UDP-glucose 4-epimerase